MINIAIDGHAGSGKSFITEQIGKILNLKILNTGEIYRGIACAYKNANLGEPTEEKINNFIKNLDIKVFFIEDKQHIKINDIDYTPYLRSEEISILTSHISIFKEVRDKALILQRDFAAENDCILEGRDIGTVVLPNATVKFFVTASIEERAKRRLKQLNSSSYEEVLQKLKERDLSDETRELSPLKKADDAILIDTSFLTEQEEVDLCVKIIKDKLEKLS